MNRLALTLAAVGLAGSLAACSKKEAATTESAAATPATATSTAAAPAAGSDMASMSAGSKTAKGTGTVTAVDAAAGTITLNHGPLPEANWPAMTMAFKASSDLAKTVKVGDKVAFDLTLQGGAGEITAISKQ